MSRSLPDKRRIYLQRMALLSDQKAAQDRTSHLAEHRPAATEGPNEGVKPPTFCEDPSSSPELGTHDRWAHCARAA